MSTQFRFVQEQAGEIGLEEMAGAATRQLLATLEETLSSRSREGIERQGQKLA